LNSLDLFVGIKKKHLHELDSYSCRCEKEVNQEIKEARRDQAEARPIPLVT